MKKSWTLGLDAVKKDEVINEYHASATLRRRLVAMLEKTRSDAQAKSLREAHYESPNWGYIQADSVGYQRALSEIIDLIQ